MTRQEATYLYLFGEAVSLNGLAADANRLGQTQQAELLSRKALIVLLRLQGPADPLSAAARSWLARALVGQALDLMSGSPAADIRRAEELIARVLAASPNNAQAHFVKGQILRAQSRPEAAIFEYETTITLDRNHAPAYGWLGACKLLTGATDEVVAATCVGGEWAEHRNARI